MKTKTLRNIASSLFMTLLLFLLVGWSGGAWGQATVTTDKPDYLPGDRVIITGEGWWANEAVEMTIEHLNYTGPGHYPEYLSSEADEFGDFINNSYVIDPGDLGERFLLTAVGMSSGMIATVEFTDGNALDGDGNVTVNPITVCGAGTYNFTFSFRTENGKDWLSGAQATFTFPAAWAVATYSVTGINGTATLGTPTGTTYPVNFNCSGGIANGFDLTVTGAPMPAYVKYIIPIQTKKSGGTLTDLKSGFPFVKSSATSNGTLVGSINSCNTSANGDLTYYGYSGTIIRWEYRELTSLYPMNWTAWSELTGGGLGNPAVGTSYNNNNVAYTTQYRVVTTGASCGTSYGGEYYSDTAMVALGTNPIIVAEDIVNYVVYPLTVNLNDHVEIFTVVPIVSVNYYINYIDLNNRGTEIFSPHTFGPGTTTVTVVAVNICGTMVDQFDVTSGMPPQITCPADITAYTSDDGFGNCNTVVTYTLYYDGPGATATPTTGHYIGNPTPTISYNLDGGTTYSPGSGSGLIYQKGTTTVYLKASNAAGDAYCNFDITVEDDEAPTLIDDEVTCSSLDETGLNWCLSEAEAFNATTLEDEVAALYEDNCPGVITATLTDTEAGAENGDCEWIFTYEFTISDIVGNETVCYVVYSGGDTEAPTLEETFPVGETDMNLCFDEIPVGPTEEDIADLYSDNCTTTVTVDKTGTPTGDDCEWTVTYYYDVYDDCGNHVSPTPFITYSGGDTEAPTLEETFPVGETDMNLCFDEIPVGPTEEEIAALYSDNCTVGVNVDKSGTPTGDDCEWTVTYYYDVYDDCGNHVSPTPYVTYSGGDTEAPTLEETFPVGETDMNLCFDEIPVGPTEEEIAALYSDNCTVGVNVDKSGTPAGNDCEWTVTYYYDVYDDCGNHVSPTPFITYSGGDTEAPTLEETFPVGETDMNLCFDAIPVGPTEAEIAALYSDNCTTTVTVDKTGTPTGDDCEWTVTYYYDVYDDCGNHVSPTPSITYSGSDQTPPSGTPPAAITGLNDCKPSETEAGAEFDASYAAYGYTDNCGGNVSAVLTDTDVSGDNCSWTITYTYDVLDECLNALEGEFYTVSGGDETPPTVLTKPIDVRLELGGVVTITHDAVDNGSYDNCSSTLTFELSQTVFTCDDIGVNTVTLTVTDECENSATGTAVVTIYVPTQTTAYVSAESTRYKDMITLYAVIDSYCGTASLTGTVDFYLDDYHVGTANAYPVPYGEDDYGKLRASLLYQICYPILPKPDGNDPDTFPDPYIVLAEFTPSSPYFDESDDDTTLIVFRRRATPFTSTVGFYTGPTFAWTPNPNNSTATVALSATITDASTPDGDVRAATISFYYLNTSGGWTPIPSAQNLPVGLVDQTDGKVGTANADVQFNIGNKTSESWIIGIVVGGAYYNDVDEPESQQQITVFKYIPGGRILGGADLVNTTKTNGQIKGAIGLTTDVSFDVKFNKSGKNPQGRVNITVFSWYDADGLLDDQLHEYLIVSNAITAVVVNPNTNPPAAFNGYFSGKANLSERTAEGIVPIEGNSVLQLWIDDLGVDGGSPDGLLGIQYDKKGGGIWYSNYWDLGTTQMEEIAGEPDYDGGLVDVRPPFTSDAEAEGPIVTETPLAGSFTVYPNPFVNTTNFHFVPEADVRAKLELFDIHGRLVETLYEGSVKAGEKYEVQYHRTGTISGMLIYRLTMGDKVTTGKLFQGNF